MEGETLLEKRASLSAKLLSFDDSLLQSPKLLQSTAALTASASSQKLKNKRFRPPTVSTTFRDPTFRSNAHAFRSAAAAAAALAANKSLFPICSEHSTSLSLSRLPYVAQPAKAAGANSASWLSSRTPVAGSYYGYFPSSDLYASGNLASPAAVGVGVGVGVGFYTKDIGQPKYLASPGWALAQQNQETGAYGQVDYGPVGEQGSTRQAFAAPTATAAAAAAAAATDLSLLAPKTVSRSDAAVSIACPTKCLHNPVRCTGAASLNFPLQLALFPPTVVLALLKS